MNKENANKHFPLYKYTYEESVYGRDGGSEWADPENDIRKKQGLTYFKKENIDSKWVEIYSERCGDPFHASSQAVETLGKLCGLCEPSEKDCMFFYEGTMFKLTNYFADQKSICGVAIDSHFYNDYEDDTSIKIGLVESYVEIYPENQLVIKKGKVYLNCEIKLNKAQIEELGFRYHQVLAMYPKNVENKMKELFPEATEYSSWSGWGKFR